MSGWTNLQREKESLPFLAPEIRQDGSGSDRKHQCHHDTSLTQTKKDRRTQLITRQSSQDKYLKVFVLIYPPSEQYLVAPVKIQSLTFRKQTHCQHLHNVWRCVRKCYIKLLQETLIISIKFIISFL